MKQPLWFDTRNMPMRREGQVGGLADTYVWHGVPVNWVSLPDGSWVPVVIPPSMTIHQGDRVVIERVGTDGCATWRVAQLLQAAS